MTGDEFNTGSPTQMRDVLDKLKEIGGADWAKGLAEEMTEGERFEFLRELAKHKEPLTEPAPPPPGKPLTEPHPAHSGRPPLTEPAPPPPGKPLNG